MNKIIIDIIINVMSHQSSYYHMAWKSEFEMASKSGAENLCLD